MMRKRLPAVFLSAATLIVAASPLSGAVLSFNGNATATASTSPDPSCDPLPFRGIVLPSNGSGTSNLGSFTYGHNVCTQGQSGGPVIGTFAIDFGSFSLSGLLDGISSPHPGTPGLFDQMFTYTITGGTGQFAGATGTFTNVGTVDVRGGPPSRLTLNFAGMIDAPAVVPEPAGWALMLGGFALAGAAVRRRPVEWAFG